MFVGAAVAYIIAVAQRSSLGVAGVEAMEHFGANATQLSALGVAQIFVYAGLQIPVGMLLDRFGATRLITIGAGLMVAGQAAVALSPELAGALVGRMLVGAGDATTFVSGLRLIGAWFPARRVPVMTQWYSATGQLGQVLSAVPFAALLGVAGWTASFLSLVGLAGVSLAVSVAVTRDSAERKYVAHRVSFRSALVKVGHAVAHPGTRLGFWTHFTTQFPMAVFSLLWGYPFLVLGLGYEPGVASLLLALIVVIGIAAGPVIGILTARFPFRRSNLVLGITGTTLIAWLVVLLWPGTPPFWVVLALVCVLGIGGVGAPVGFDFARTANPADRFGSASGVVNVGGFTATFLTMFVIGLVLDVVSAGGGTAADFDRYRASFIVVPVMLALGMAAIAVERRHTRNRLEAEEGIEIGPLWVAIARRLRRGGAGPGA